MRKIISLILLLCLVLSPSAFCTELINMQEIYDAGQNEALLKKHQSVYIQNVWDNGSCSESYLTKDYIYNSDDAYDWVEFLTDDAYYSYYEGAYGRVFPITPDGIIDVPGLSAEFYPSLFFGEETVYEVIESVTQEDGRIIVVSYINQEGIENIGSEGVISIKYEYVLDDNTREIMSGKSIYTYEDGTVTCIVSEVTYDTEEVPEKAKVFMEYVHQTEDLRNITVVTNPGTEKEISQNWQMPKGLLIDFGYVEDYEGTYELYTDAACTETYDLFANTDSDLTIYVKWAE